MARIVIVAHAPMASALVAVGRHVFPDAEDIFTFDLEADSSPENDHDRIFNAIFSQSVEEVLILTDLCGSTPSNVAYRVAMSLKEQGLAAELICGVNPSMVLAAIAYKSLGLVALGNKVIEGGTQSIRMLVTEDSV